ncbi:MAG: hypothetical protein OXT68_05575 [Chloroflexota bacterium]|nr:hypothetical protein [Chloroflexota bacterium]
MELIPHIDLIEPERIEALFRDPRNYAWRAVDCETLDTWSPDFGLTAYPAPSIVRAGAVAESGRSSTLRHRFWQTIESQADHTGRRYIGILIYCKAGETCPMELRLASQDIGRLAPSRHDNRLHLIVADKPVRFMGAMEVFRLTAPGPGSYRIEGFVLLRERPMPSRFAPEIANLSLRADRAADGSWVARLHFTTSRLARVDATITEHSSAFRARQSAKPARLHHLLFSDLPAGRSCEAEVTAVDPAGESVTETLAFSTSQPEGSPAERVVVPLELMNLNKSDLAGLPLVFGLPFSKGALPRIETCRLHVKEQALPAGAWAQSRWDDGSARWALVESRIPQGLACEGSLSAELHVKAGDATADPPGGTVFERNDDALRLKSCAADLSIERRLNDNWEKALSLSDLSFRAILSNGAKLRSSAIRRRSRDSPAFQFEVNHEDERGVAHLRSNMRLQFYPDQRFIKLHHRLEVISPALAPAAQGGALPGDSDASITSAIVGDSGEESALLKLRSFSIGIPFSGATVVRQSEQTWRVADGSWQLRHDHDLAYEIGGETREGRAPGHIRVDGDSGALGIGLRHFWQLYPKMLSVDEGGISIQLFPERGGIDLPGDEDAPHRLYCWLDDDGYILKSGLALSNEILIDFGGDQPAVFDWLEQGVLARPDIDYLNSTGALYPLGARRDSTLPDYEKLADSALASFHDDREHFRAYGQVNFGDWYGESGWSWGNNEYDPAYCAYTEFLRGGDPCWAAWAAESARHLADVDTINFSGDPSEIGGQSMHMPGHLGGYLPPLFRSKMAGTKTIPSHTWVEGPMLHYLLTGDDFVYESLRKTRNWLLQKRFFDHYDFSNAREAGWHLIHLCMLAAAGDDPDCLNAASIIVERVLERAEPEGGWVRNLTESHCGCGYPRCRGEAGFMVGVLLSGLKRYYFLTADPRVGEAIIGGARWLIRETFDHESGHFRYTSCPNRTLGGNFRCTQWVLEGLAAAWELSGDADIALRVKKGLPAIGLFPEWISHLGMGKAMSQQMRYVPTILATLKSRPLEGENDD